MPTVKLTDRGVKNLTTEKVQEEFCDELLPGFMLRVGRGGSKTWMVRYRSNGTHRRFKLGTYPRMSLADARTEARAKLAATETGVDPAQERETRRSKDTTFKALADEVLEAKATSTREKTQRERRRIVDAYLLPAWGSRPAGSITRRDVVELVERIARRGAPVMANRTLTLVNTIFNTGIRRGFPELEANPAHLVEPPGEEAGRDRYLTREEIKIVWNATAWEAPVTRAVFRLALLTAQRIGSVCSLRWSDIDGADVWRIPASAFKGRRPHLVPLSTEALAVLEEVRELTGGEEYAFPGRSDGKKPHMTSVNKAVARIRERTPIPAWSPHDFRTTFRTHATRARKPKDKRDPAGLGVAPTTADAVLGHKEASLGFDRYTAEPERYLLSEKRDALRRWGAFVAAAVKEGGR